MNLLAIDPGTTRSAWVMYDTDDAALLDFGIADNDTLLADFRRGLIRDVDVLVIEKVESFGMAVGKEVFETIFWYGRVAEALYPMTTYLIGRKAVKSAMCGSIKANDSNIRAAVIDAFGGVQETKKGGKLYKVSKDVWSALALALTFSQQ